MPREWQASGLKRLHGGPEAPLARADACRREVLRREELARRGSRSRPAVTDAMRSSVSSIGTISVSVTVALPSRVIRAEVDSERQQQAALHVLLRPLELAVANVAGADVLELGRDHVEALAQVLLPRADVDPDLAGVHVLRPVRVDASRPCRASRGSPGTGGTTRSRRGSRRAAPPRSGAGRRGEIPGPARQTWYCSVFLRWKRSAGSAAARRRLRACERGAAVAVAVATLREGGARRSWSTLPAAASTTFGPT